MLTLFLLQLHARLPAQAYTISSLTVNEGLSQGFVTAICQDKRGFMWIGTTNGLNRYDGFNIEVLNSSSNTKPVLSNIDITSLDTDSTGLLWVGTTEGLYVLEPESRRVGAARALCPELPEGTVSSVFCDKKGALFVTIKSGKRPFGLFRLHIPAGLREVVLNNQWKPVRLKCDKIPASPPAGTADMILGIVSDSILLLKNNSDQLFRFTEKKGVLTSLPFDQASRLAQADANVLWTETAGYLFKKDTASQAACLTPSEYNAIFYKLGAQKTFVYLAAKNQLYETKSVRETASAILSNREPFLPGSPPGYDQATDLNGPASRAIFSDKSGNIWIGTLGYGMRIVKPNRIPFEHLFPNYSAYNFRLIDSTHIWMGKSHPNDLFQFKTKKIDTAPWRGKLPVKFKLFNVVRDRDGNFWMTGQTDTISTVVVFSPRTGKSQILSDQLKNLGYVAEQLLSDRNGNIWVGAHEGFCLRYRPGARQAERFSYLHLLPPGIKNIRCNALEQTPDGDLFVGTSRGLIHIANPNGVPKFLLYQNKASDPGSPENNAVLNLYTDEAFPNTLWIGTQGGGLNRMDISTGQFSSFTEADGLLNNVIYGILSDSTHKLWLSSNRGISLYDPATGTCRNFQKSDGLAAGEFNTGASLRLPDGQLLFGSVDGLILLHPKSINLGTHPIPVAVTNIRILGSPAGKSAPPATIPGLWQNLRLQSNQNNLIFEFAGLDFGNPPTNRYRYRLLGLDSRWINNGTLRTANYSGLAPGNYTFEVQATTAFGDWPDETAQINFIILAPWYRSWVAYAIYGMLLILANILYLRFREKQLQLAKKTELAQQESLRLQELDAFKNRLLANITHEFRMPLTIILGLAERLRLGKNAGSVDLSTNILQQGENMLELLNQMTDLSSLSENKIQLHYRCGNITNHIRYFAESLRSLATDKDIDLLVHSDVPDIVMDFDLDRLRQMIVNLLSNAIRHTPSRGKISVTLSSGDSLHLTIRISDTGEGIDKIDLPHIFERFYQAPGNEGSGYAGLGLALTKDLVSLMGGSIAVESEPGHGSVFTVQLPITRNAGVEEGSKVQGWISSEIAVSETEVELQTDKPVVVVIEDNRVVSNYLVTCLAPAFQVCTEENGELGIATVSEMVPDLVITDLTVPGKNGFEVVRTLKAQEITSHIPIVMLSANARVEERIKGRRLGADAYLGKPFHEEELLLVIKNLMDLRLLWQQRYARTSDQASPGAPPFPADMQDAVKKEDAFMAKIYAIFEEHYARESFSLDDLCLALGYSKSKLQRKLAILTNQPPMHMLRNFRLQKAYDLLKNHPEMNVSAVCFQVGFNNTSHFSRLFSKKFNLAPSDVRAGGA